MHGMGNYVLICHNRAKKIVGVAGLLVRIDPHPDLPVVRHANPLIFVFAHGGKIVQQPVCARVDGPELPRGRRQAVADNGKSVQFSDGRHRLAIAPHGFILRRRNLIELAKRLCKPGRRVEAAGKRGIRHASALQQTIRRQLQPAVAQIGADGLAGQIGKQMTKMVKGIPGYLRKLLCRNVFADILIDIIQNPNQILISLHQNHASVCQYSKNCRTSHVHSCDFSGKDRRAEDRFARMEPQIRFTYDIILRNHIQGIMTAHPAARQMHG